MMKKFSIILVVVGCVFCLSACSNDKNGEILTEVTSDMATNIQMSSESKVVSVKDAKETEKPLSNLSKLNNDVEVYTEKNEESSEQVKDSTLAVKEKVVEETEDKDNKNDDYFVGTDFVTEAEKDTSETEVYVDETETETIYPTYTILDYMEQVWGCTEKQAKLLKFEIEQNSSKIRSINLIIKGKDEKTWDESYIDFVGMDGKTYMAYVNDSFELDSIYSEDFPEERQGWIYLRYVTEGEDAMHPGDYMTNNDKGEVIVFSVSPSGHLLDENGNYLTTDGTVLETETESELFTEKETEKETEVKKEINNKKKRLG